MEPDEEGTLWSFGGDGARWGAVYRHFSTDLRACLLRKATHGANAAAPGSVWLRVALWRCVAVCVIPARDKRAFVSGAGHGRRARAEAYAG